MTTATRRASEVEVGEELPRLDIPLTRTLIVSTAIASRDYQDVHHDPGLAQERGSKDIFMNILTTNGFVGRYITDWAGPNAVLKSVRIRLGAPNYPGDTMSLTGRVTKKEDRLVEISVRGANSLGDHVSGTVSVELHDPPLVWTESAPSPGEKTKPGEKAKKDKKKKKKHKKKKHQKDDE